MRISDWSSDVCSSDLRATFEESGNHFESGYHLTLVYLPPEESRARAAGMLYENRPTDGVDWRERLQAFVAETDRVFDLLDGVMPEIAWLDDGQTLTYLPATIPKRRTDASRDRTRCDSTCNTRWLTEH